MVKSDFGHRCKWWGGGLAIAAALVALSAALAQQPVVIPAGANPEQAHAMAEAQRAQAQAQGGQPQPKPDEKKEGEKKEGEGGEKKKEEGGDSVKRPDKPPRVPDPRELEVALDKNGNVPPFNFIGQAWPDVMQWLANLSKCSLNWLELPSGYLNLTTQRPYSLDEEYYTLAAAERDGLPAVALLNLAYIEFDRCADYPWLLSVTLDLQEQRDDGLPTDGEANVLNQAEDAIEAALAGVTQFHHIARQSWNGKRIIDYYVQSGDEARICVEQLSGSNAVPRHLEAIVEKDPEWSSWLPMLQSFA